MSSECVVSQMTAVIGVKFCPHTLPHLLTSPSGIFYLAKVILSGLVRGGLEQHLRHSKQTSITRQREDITKYEFVNMADAAMVEFHDCGSWF